jgi:hypothetical protein
LVKLWDDREWDRLLRCVEQGAVIPVVGAELSLVLEGALGFHSRLSLPLAWRSA